MSKVAVRRYALQSVARSWLSRPPADWDEYRGLRSARLVEAFPWHRLFGCHRSPICKDGAESGVLVLHDPEALRAYYSGLQSCGSVSACPVCQGAIMDYRAGELASAVDAHRSGGGSLAMVTLTAAHSSPRPLSGMYAAMARSLRGLYTGDVWSAFAGGSGDGYLGHLRVWEVTYGDHGFHPHVHALWFLGSLSSDNLADYVHDRWPKLLARQGLWCSAARGVTVLDATDDVQAYMTKAGMDVDTTWDITQEMTQAGRKSGRGENVSMHDLLVNGLLLRRSEEHRFWYDWSRRVYIVYAHAVKGKHLVRWSRGLLGRLGQVGSASDEDIVSAAVYAARCRVLARLSPAQWRLVLASDARGELLSAAAEGSSTRVWQVLSGLGVEVA